MKALLLVAHGSRKESSNHELSLLAEKINQLLDGDFDFVRHGFLELAEPSIPKAIDECAVLGAKNIIVVPYFLSAGRHVTEDIPEEVRKGKLSNPNTNIEISKYLGSRNEIADLLIKSALCRQSEIRNI
jgi:sirohydrochlorin ferrochelatase